MKFCSSGSEVVFLTLSYTNSLIEKVLEKIHSIYRCIKANLEIAENSRNFVSTLIEIYQKVSVE